MHLFIPQWRRKHSNIVCAIHKVRPKYWVRKIYILFTNGPNIGCANAHPAHPAPPPLLIIWMSMYYGVDLNLYFLMTQILGVQMHTLRTQLRRP